MESSHRSGRAERRDRIIHRDTGEFREDLDTMRWRSQPWGGLSVSQRGGPKGCPERGSLPPRVPAVFCLVFLGALVSTALAQQRFDSWTTENGLPQNSVNDIVQ